MNKAIDQFRNLATVHPGMSRVGLQGEKIRDASTSFMGKMIGIITGTRRAENAEVYHRFAHALQQVYGHAGLQALREYAPKENKALSSARIAAILTKAQLQPHLDARKSAVVSTQAQWMTLDAVDPRPGDILIKKVFPEQTKTRAERLITSAQQSLKGLAVDTVTADGVKTEFPFLGDPSSSHVAVAIGKEQIAEAEGGGVHQNRLQDRTHNRYVIFRPKPEFAAHIAQAAKLLSQPGPNGETLGYSYYGTASSSLRNPIGKGAPKDKEKQLDSGMRYLQDKARGGPSMFCSEFAAVSIQLASELNRELKSTSLGVSPKAVTPMVLEDLLYQRPDLFDMVGRAGGEEPQDTHARELA